MAWWLQVRPGAIELSPDECAIIVNYEVRYHPGCKTRYCSKFLYSISETLNNSQGGSCFATGIASSVNRTGAF
eukprot:1196393-Prorocentrum_minimum.AAC.8